MNINTFCSLLLVFAITISSGYVKAQEREVEQTRQILAELVDGIESGNTKEDLVFLVGRDHAERMIRSLRDLEGRVHAGDETDLRTLVASYSRAQREGLTRSNADRLQKSIDALSKSIGLYTSPSAFMAKYPFSLLLSQYFTRSVDFTYTQWDRLERFALRDRDIAQALLGQQRNRRYRSLVNKRGPTMRYNFISIGSTQPLAVVCNNPLPKIGIDLISTRMSGHLVLVTTESYSDRAVERVGITLFEENAAGERGRVIFMHLEDGRFIDTERNQIAAYSIDPDDIPSAAGASIIAQVSIGWQRDWTSRLRGGSRVMSGCAERLRLR